MLRAFIVMYVNSPNTNVQPFPPITKEVKSLFYLIYSDIWGLSPIPNISKACCSGEVTTFLVYVVNIIMIGNEEKERKTLRQCLPKEFDIKELGRLKYFLGIKVAQSKHRILISQQKYITNLLKETGKLTCKLANTPIDPNHNLEEAGEDAMLDREIYQHVVERLIYLSHIRLDITYVVSVISQFMHSLKEVHL